MSAFFFYNQFAKLKIRIRIYDIPGEESNSQLMFTMRGIGMLVFYNHKQQVDECQSYSPSARKPRLVVQAWKKEGKVEVKRVKPLNEDLISLAHDKSYVRGIFNLKTKNGFGNKSKEIAESLRWTTGSFVSAAVYAYQNRTTVFSPTSGFHHACYDHAEGFCTFSGLTLAGLILNKFYGVKRVGIIDFDSHPGNGTLNTIERTGSQNLFCHYSLGYERVNHGNRVEWLDRLPKLLKTFNDCQIILYQAGMDCHEDDPLVMSGHFSDEQIYERDLVVFDTFKKLSIPLVCNLAGGYQEPLQKVIDLHNLTAKAYFNVINKGGERWHSEENMVK